MLNLISYSNSDVHGASSLLPDLPTISLLIRQVRRRGPPCRGLLRVCWFVGSDRRSSGARPLNFAGRIQLTGHFPASMHGHLLLCLRVLLRASMHAPLESLQLSLLPLEKARESYRKLEKSALRGGCGEIVCGEAPPHRPADSSGGDSGGDRGASLPVRRLGCR